MRLAVGIAALAVIIAGIGAVAANGCTIPLSQEGYCALDNLAAATNTSQGCQECLFANKQCCDAYGACQEAGAGCPDEAAKAVACVLEAGTLGRDQEPRCLQDASIASTAVYGCVKDSCAAACGLGAAACLPDPAVPTISSPTCDSCTTTRCCTNLNACYESRPCKVAFECVLSCPEFATLFTDQNAGPAIKSTIQDICHGTRGPDFLQG